MTPRGQPREQRFAFVLTDEERAMLDALARADQRTAGDWLRVVIRNAYTEHFGDKAPGKRKRKKR